MNKIKIFILCFFAVGLLWAEASAPEGSLQGWTLDQLKAEVYRLRRDNQDLRDKLGLTDKVDLKGKNSVQIPKGSWKIDDFENPSPASGIGAWWTGCDNNDMGTTLSPSPYERLEGGSPLSPGFSAGIRGHIGPSEAPWTWAYLQAPLAGEEKKVDLNQYSALWFTAKGDGKYYIVTLRREAVQDGCNFEADFQATGKWTLVKIPLAKFTQASWGVQKPRTFPDAKEISFSPEIHEADYDLQVDDIVFVK